MKRKTLNIIFGAVLVLLLASETIYSFLNTEFSEQQTGDTIQIVHNPWDTEIASATVLGLVLEEAGFNVRLISVDNAIMFESIATGTSDIMTAAWLPTTHSVIYEEYEDSLENLGENLEGAETGLAVPAYMDATSIADLDDQADQTIMGIEPGAGIMIQTEEAMEVYDNLNGWDLEAPSTGAMLASLDSAIQNEEEFVFTGWTPHWMFLDYDLTLLEDPEMVYGEAENIYTLVREGFQEEYPGAYQIADNFYWEIDDMDNVTYNMEQGMDDRAAAQNWIDNNRETVDSWLEGVVE